MKLSETMLRLERALKALEPIVDAHSTGERPCSCDACEAWHRAFRALQDYRRPGWRGPPPPDTGWHLKS